MNDPRDYKVDLSSPAPLPSAGEAGRSGAVRPFLSILFACCGVYQRIYRDSDGARYAGRCPCCGKQVRFAVGPHGTTTRFFVVE